jgi:hypothetical protein
MWGNLDSAITRVIDIDIEKLSDMEQRLSVPELAGDQILPRV